MVNYIMCHKLILKKLRKWDIFCETKAPSTCKTERGLQTATHLLSKI